MGHRTGRRRALAGAVPAALAVSHTFRDDFAGAILTAISLGGDTDTIAALVGGIVGAQVGVAGIPEGWREGIVGTSPARPTLPAMALTHALALPVILTHGLRRCLPPY